MPFASEARESAPDLYRARFEACFREHYAQLLGFAIRRTTSRPLAEDAVAETFAVAWRKRDRIPDPALPWLYAIGLRVLANQRRSDQRREALGERLTLEARYGDGGPDLAEAISRRDALATAFGRLKEEEREVLRLIAWDGLDNDDAARVLGCSPGAFRVRLHRARRKLEKQLRVAGHLPGERRAAAPDPAKETG